MPLMHWQAAGCQAPHCCGTPGCCGTIYHVASTRRACFEPNVWQLLALSHLICPSVDVQMGEDSRGHVLLCSAPAAAQPSIPPVLLKTQKAFAAPADVCCTISCWKLRDGDLSCCAWQLDDQVVGRLLNKPQHDCSCPWGHESGVAYDVLLQLHTLHTFILPMSQNAAAHADEIAPSQLHVSGRLKIGLPCAAARQDWVHNFLGS